MDSTDTSDATDSSAGVHLWNQDHLLVPAAPAGLLDSIQVFDYSQVGTLDTPGAKSDYLLDPSTEYLRSEVPDQYVLSYWGHGINSYALSFRFAFGSIAGLVQIGCGGAYGNIDTQAAAWNACMRDIDQITVRARTVALDARPRQRSTLLVYSDFRELQGTNDIQVGAPAVKRCSPDGWESHYTFTTWNALAKKPLS